MRRLCFGGSFNPIHLGHLRCAKVVAEACRYDRVVLIPTNQPPHKAVSADLASPADRLAMCRLAAASDPLFEVSNIEISRPGMSYTIETARELRAAGWKSVDWLIGADMLQILPRWHKPMELLKEVNFVIMARPGWEFDWQSLPGEFRHLESHVVQAPLIDISATEIRRRIAQRESIRDLVPAAVGDYIELHQLYRADKIA
jgi:nicotinate-nucleotide adenylyltransferase